MQASTNTIDIDSFWEYTNPAVSEARFRTALTSAHGDERLELLTQIARTYGLRQRFSEAHDVLNQVEEQLIGAGPRPCVRYLLERGRTFNAGGEKRMEDSDVVKAEIDPTSIAVVPLAIPMLSGPGAITSVMVLVNTYPAPEQKMAIIVSIAAVGLCCYVVLLGAMPLSRMIGARGRTVFTKIMALLLGAIGIQFIINGIKPVALELLRSV